MLFPFYFSPIVSLFHFLSLLRFPYAPFRSSLLLVSFLFPSFASTSFLHFPVSSPHSSSRLSPSLFRNSFALPRSLVLSFVFPAVFLFVFLALWPLPPFATSSFHWERLVCEGFLYRNGASAAAVRSNGRQGATREATRKDFREPQKGPRRDVAFNLQPRFWSSCMHEPWTHLSRRKRIKCSHEDYHQGSSLVILSRYWVHS